MKEYLFNYYDKFSCIAGKCKHTCCRGWEILIDKKTLKKYKKKKDDYSLNLKSGIDFKNKRFKFSEDKRCAFLNSENLCDLIINYDKDHLCQVCRDHPRFRSFFNGRIETGLGLSCEEACRIILGSKEKITLILNVDKKERLSKFDKQVLEFRDKVLLIVQDRSMPFLDRLGLLLNEYKIGDLLSVLNDYKSLLLGFEVLDESWKKSLDEAIFDANIIIKDEIVLEQLLSYFIFRHVSKSSSEQDLNLKLIFSLISTIIILSLSNSLNSSIFDTARSYSAEIEYSDDNLTRAYDFIERYRRLGKI